VIEFYIDDDQEKKLKEWRNKIRSDPSIKHKPEKFIFWSTGIGMVCEVTRGPYKIDLTDVETW